METHFSWKFKWGIMENVTAILINDQILLIDDHIKSETIIPFLYQIEIISSISHKEKTQNIAKYNQSQQENPSKKKIHPNVK